MADDHSRIREAIESVLSSSFDVVAAVANGREAVDAAEQLNPDVVVLDITMPVLDGLAAARELVRRGTRARLLFLTVHSSDEFVAAAIEAGAQGYVVKSRLSTDLVDAIGHVLAGRLRLPTVSSLLGIADSRARHAAQFHSNGEARLDNLCELAVRGLRAGSVVAAVGSQAMLSGVASRLSDAGLDVASLSARGRYQAFDAKDALSQIMHGDEPDEVLLGEFVQALERPPTTAVNGETSDVVVFGEMSALLLRDGNASGALALERMWHGNASTSAFHTVCSYSGEILESSDQPDVFDRLCRPSRGKRLNGRATTIH